MKMNVLESICPNLETAKRLVKMGIEIESVFCNSIWAPISWTDGTMNQEEIFFHADLAPYEMGDGHTIEHYPMPISDEIEAYITKNYFSYEIKLFSHYNEGKTRIECYVFGVKDRQTYIKSQWYEKKVEALSEILIELKKKGLI